MIDAVISWTEVSILHITDEVLGEESVALPESVRDVDATAETLLLRARTIERRTPDDGPVEVHAEHQVGRETRGHTGEIIPSVGADEVADDVAPRPVALGKLIVVVRQGRCARVLEPRLEPVLAEKPKKVNATNRSDRAPLREQIRREEVPDPTARAALAARIVPVELPVHLQISAR